MAEWVREFDDTSTSFRFVLDVTLRDSGSTAPEFEIGNKIEEALEDLGRENGGEIDFVRYSMTASTILADEGMAKLTRQREASEARRKPKRKL